MAQSGKAMRDGGFGSSDWNDSEMQEIISRKDAKTQREKKQNTEKSIRTAMLG